MISVRQGLTQGRFLLGDTESKGFLYHCFQIKNGSHYFCCLYLETLNKLICNSYNSNCDKFLKILSCIPLTKLKQIGIGSHVDSTGLRKCREFIYEFIFALQNSNPRTNYLLLFTSTRSRSAFEGWKSRSHKTTNLSYENSQCCSPQESKNSENVFAQQPTISDIQLKQSRFLEETRKSCDKEGSAFGEVVARCDIVNYEMAILNTRLPIRLDLAVEAQNFINSSNQKLDSEIISKIQDSVYHNLEVQGLKPKTDKDEGIALMLFKDGAVEIKINHKNTSFLMGVRSSFNLKKLSEHSEVISFNFESSTDSIFTNEQISTKQIEKEILNERKFSIGNCSIDSAVCDPCWSNSSTVAGSDAFLQQKTVEELVCNLCGDLTLVIENPKGGLSNGVPVLSINLFLNAKDKASKAFIQAMPDIKHSVNIAILESFFMLARLT